MAKGIEFSSKHDTPELLAAQKVFFNSGKTLDVEWRIERLKALRKEIGKREKDISEALYADFKKPEFETFVTETSIILSELKFIISNLKKWAKPLKVKSSILNFPSSDYIYQQPYGNCLVLAPWNYPFQLSVSPAIGAFAAGNTVILKPSEYSPKTSALIEEIFANVFSPEEIAVVQGGIPVSEELLQQKWDYVFFTGSVAVGKIVAKAIAPNLTPSTLELGGKNPCIIHPSAKIALAAKRIVWGKFINAGQTCIAPDYILVHSSQKHNFIQALQKEIIGAFGTDIKASPDYARIVNRRNFDRLETLMQGQHVIFGGETDASENFIAPSLLDQPDLNSEVMQEEIFGPLLPILIYSEASEIKEILSRFPDPLALYVFSEDREFSEDFLQKYSFGGGSVNDVVVHIANKNLPFGGVGNSGYGAYHGKFSFDTFTHKKSISKRSTRLDLPMRYAPYGQKKLNLVRKILKYF